MAYKIEALVKQYKDVVKRYNKFRDNPNEKLEEDFELSLDVLESMIPIYETGSGKKLNPNKQEQGFLDHIKDRNSIENVLEAQYDFQHKITDKFIDLEDAEKISKIKNDTIRSLIIEKALKGQLYDLDDVIKELGIDID